MKRDIEINGKCIGNGFPVYIIAEIGINHNSSIEIAKRLIDAAIIAGCDAVKFQKRTPEKCVPKDQWNIERDTPWGRMKYIDYRHKMEFTGSEMGDLESYCDGRIELFASVWDIESISTIEQFMSVKAYKIPSACITDLRLLEAAKNTSKPIIFSTGMSTTAEIADAAKSLDDNYAIAHCTSTYPCPPEEINLRMINTLKMMFPRRPVGYSGHETGLTTTFGAVAMGANFIERHITLDRAMWGTDQAASIEPAGLIKLVKHIRVMEKAMGDGEKKVYDSEQGPKAKLRRV